MRTTLVISDALLRQLRRRAAASDRPFREIVEETLARGLAAESKKSKRGGPFRVRPHPLGLKPGFRGLSLNQLYDQIDAEASTRKP